MADAVEHTLNEPADGIYASRLFGNLPAGSIPFAVVGDKLIVQEDSGALGDPTDIRAELVKPGTHIPDGSLPANATFLGLATYASGGKYLVFV